MRYVIRYFELSLDKDLRKSYEIYKELLEFFVIKDLFFVIETLERELWANRVFVRSFDHTKKEAPKHLLSRFKLKITLFTQKYLRAYINKTKNILFEVTKL